MVRHELGNAETIASGDGPPTTGPQRATAPTETPTPVTAGPRLGRYVILAQIGEGAMGEVYSGYDRELDRRVALKVVRSHRADAVGKARMQREAQALARLSHPNVVQVHDVGEIDGQLFVAMEYVKGETLGAWQAHHDPTTPAGRRAIVDMYVQAGRGLVAAHAAGIVHRDFKPSNVLVGDDERARVLDFGLAAGRRDASGGSALDVTGDDERDALSDTLTRTGSVLGTPAYMAPEQFLAQPIDVRTDVFAFSVALFEALHGLSPFAGDTFAAKQMAVVSGELRGPPAGSNVPAWLHAVIARGLALAPADRHPTMEAMLAALVDDPLERRRRSWRLALFGAGAVVIASVVILAGLWGWQRWQHGVAEGFAADRLDAAMIRIDAALATGAVAEAEQVFTAFVDDPGNRGTAALGRAWLQRADRARALGDTARAVDAFAGAYMVASTADEQVAPRVGLARVFRDEMRWRGLLLALSALEERGADAVDPGELAGLRLDAAVARRDLAAAAGQLRGPLAGSPRAAALPVLTALQQATATDHHHRGTAMVADLDGDGRPEIALDTDAQERRLAPLLRAEPGLPQIGTLDLGTATFRALVPGPGEPALIVGADRRIVDGAPANQAVVRRWSAGGLVEVFRWQDDAVIAALGADLDGDGDHELLVGTGPYTRRVTQLVPGTGGAWSTRSPAPDIDRRRSDVVDLLAEDLDGDGAVEVIAALGPWTAYELQILRHDPASDTLRMLTRRRLGNIAGAAVLHRGVTGGGPEIAVSKTDEYSKSSVFPIDRPNGEPAGIYLFRLVADELVQTAFVPAARLADDARVVHKRPLVGDLDGDGHDELIVACGIVGEHDATMILVSAADGSLVPLILADMRPITTVDVDGDGDHELLVSDTSAADIDRVWVLGSGTSAPPTLAPELAGPVDAAPPNDPLLAKAWRSADELAQMGLVRQAAARLAALADQIFEPSLRAATLLRAGRLHDSFGDDVRAGELFARAVDEPTLAREAHAAAARSLLRLGRHAEAAVHLEATRALGDPPADVAAAALALGASRDVVLEFKRPLAPTWRIGQPLALRRNGMREALHVDSLVPGELASTPALWTGRAVTLTVDLELTRAEWSSGLGIGLMRDGTAFDDGTSPLGVDIRTTGGGTTHIHEISCTSYGRRSVARIAFDVRDRSHRLGRLTIRATLLPELGEWTCEVVRATGERVHYLRNQLPAESRAGGPFRLTLSATSTNEGWLAAELHRVTLTGASLPDDEPATSTDSDRALALARHAMVEDDPLAALAAFERVAAPTPVDRLLPVAALARLGRLQAAERALAPLFAGAAPPDVVIATKALLRRSPEVFGPLLRAAAGASLQRYLLAMTFIRPLAGEYDPHAHEVLWSGLTDLDEAADDYHVVKVHAMAADGLGHAAAAERGFRAALAVLDDPARNASLIATSTRDNETVDIHIALARLALARGDEAAARRELQPFVHDLTFMDCLRAYEELRAVWDLAPE